MGLQLNLRPLFFYLLHRVLKIALPLARFSSRTDAFSYENKSVRKHVLRPTHLSIGCICPVSRLGNVALAGQVHSLASGLVLVLLALALALVLYVIKPHAHLRWI